MSELADMIIKVRSGEEEPDALYGVLDKYQTEEEYALEKIDGILMEYEDDKKRVEFVQNWIEFAEGKLIFVGKRETLSDNPLLMAQGEVFVMYMNLDEKNQDVLTYWTTLVTKKRGKANVKFVLADCPREDETEKDKVDIIEERKDGIIQFANLLERGDECVMSIPRDYVEPCDASEISQERVELKLKCPSCFVYVEVSPFLNARDLRPWRFLFFVFSFFHIVWSFFFPGTNFIDP